MSKVTAWSDMTQTEQTNYAKRILSGQTYVPEGLDIDSFWSEPREKSLRLLDEGIEASKDAFWRLSALGFEVGEFSERFVAYLITNASTKLDTSDPFIRMNADHKHGKVHFYAGWNGSFHDAVWNGLTALAAEGKTPEEADEKLNKFATFLMPGEDPIVRRFRMRYLVRSGD